MYNSTVIFQRQVFYRDPTVEWASYKYLHYLHIAVLVSFFLSQSFPLSFSAYTQQGCTGICLGFWVPGSDWPSQHLLRFSTAVSKIVSMEFATTEHWLEHCYFLSLQLSYTVNVRITAVLLGTAASMFINFLKAQYNYNYGCCNYIILYKYFCGWCSYVWSHMWSHASQQ